jgi:hypothetical protein
MTREIQLSRRATGQEKSHNKRNKMTIILSKNAMESSDGARSINRDCSDQAPSGSSTITIDLDCNGDQSVETWRGFVWHLRWAASGAQHRQEFTEV